MNYPNTNCTDKASVSTYIRCSTAEQVDSGLGLAAQQERIEAYCKSRGIRIDQVFSDEGESGGKPLAKREAGSRLLEVVEKAKGTIVVAKLDRLFRSVADAALMIERWDRLGVRLISVGEGFDMSTVYGRAMAQMVAIFAELERSLIRQRTKEALAVKKKRGQRVSRQAPFGYGFQEQPEGVVLIENSEEQASLQTMHNLRAQKHSYEGIADYLNEVGVKPHEGKCWYASTVRCVLKRQDLLLTS